MNHDLDLDGVPDMLAAALAAHEQGRRGTGRTERMIDSIRQGEAVIIVTLPGGAAEHLQRRLRERGLMMARVVTATGLEGLDKATKGLRCNRVLYDHPFVASSVKEFAQDWAKMMAECKAWIERRR